MFKGNIGLMSDKRAYPEPKRLKNSKVEIRSKIELICFMVRNTLKISHNYMSYNAL
jgi:hypothetical protein